MKIVGMQSRFWEKMAYVSPPFNGSNDEAKRNVAGHLWQTVHLSTRYPEASDNWDPVTECNKCGVLGGSERSRFACGTAPPAKKFTK